MEEPVPQQVAGTSSDALSPEDLKAAEELFLAGKRLIDDDPEEAARLLSQALEVHTKYFGETAKECVKYYLYYGIALYEQAMAATDVLGQKLQTTTEEQEAERDSKTENTDPNARSSVSQAAGSAQAGRDPQPVRPGPTSQEAESEDDGDEGSEGEDDGQGVDHDEEGKEDSGGAAADDMKLAWEMVEMARLLCEKHSLNDEMLLIEVHITLADISSEGEQFEDAVADYERALVYLQAQPNLNRRRVAEVQYKLSLMLILLDRPEDALRHTKEAIGHLLRAKADLEAQLDALAVQAASGGGDGSSNASEGGSGSGGAMSEAEVEAAGAALNAKISAIDDSLLELRDREEELEGNVAQHKSMKDVLRNAMLEAADAAAPGQAGGASAGASATMGGTFSSLSGPTNPDAKVQDLGKVGRGQRRITLQPVQAPPQTAAPSAGASGATGSSAASAPPKRSLEDVMGGGSSAGGITTIGFGAGAAAGGAGPKLPAGLPTDLLAKRFKAEPQSTEQSGAGSKPSEDTENQPNPQEQMES